MEVMSTVITTCEGWKFHYFGFVTSVRILLYWSEAWKGEVTAGFKIQCKLKKKE
ncbi:hypothetical protein GGGNBK_11435 [Sporosarcina sp. ANT_H38]